MSWSSHIGIFLSLLRVFDLVNAGCTYPNHNNKTSPPGHSRLEGLIGMRFLVRADPYVFYIGVCTSAMDPVFRDTLPDSGVVQTKDGDKKFTITVGKITDAQIVTGANWVLLEYKNGDTYNTHCNKEHRKASVMFICDKSAKIANVRVLEENTNKTEDCYYLFEIGHQSICQKTPSRLSGGSIAVMTFCIIVAVYIIIGFIIQRIRGAKGMDQFPNYGLWQDCGNLIADGCDLVFRSRPKATNHLYPTTDGRSSRQTLEPDDRHLIDDEDHDDHMLPM